MRDSVPVTWGTSRSSSLSTPLGMRRKGSAVAVVRVGLGEWRMSKMALSILVGKAKSQWKLYVEGLFPFGNLEKGTKHWAPEWT